MSAVVEFRQVSKRFFIRRRGGRTLRETVLGIFERGARVGIPGTASTLAATGESRPGKEELWALKDVSFAVEPGDCLGVIGPNGSGKSTALKLMTRILEPTSGVVRVRGKVSALLELGAAFHPDLTGRENIYLNGSVLGMDRATMRRKLDEIVAFAEMERFIDMPVKHYSSGMYVRLGFAIAIHVEPDLLLTDEVLAVGDQSFQVECHERIGAMKKAGVTIVFVSHSLGLVRGLCNKSVWLEQGRTAACGLTGEVTDAYMESVAAKEEARLSAEESSTDGEARRFGSGQAAITDVHFLDGHGARARVFLTGEPMTIQIRYHASQRVEKPIFGVAIHRSDGIHMNGPNTRFAGLDIPFIEGDGEVDYTIERLPLLAGSYDCSAAIYDNEGLHALDHLHRTHKFLVQNGQVQDQYGLFYIPARWEHRMERPLPAGDAQPEDRRQFAAS